VKEPIPLAMPSRDLLFISAGLDLDGGGRALAGRLLAGGCAAFAAERGIECGFLSLHGLDGFASRPGARSHAGRQGALALSAWRRQLTGRVAGSGGARRPRGRKVACVFDLLGPARLQGWLPPGLRAPYLVPLYGIEAWRPLRAGRLRALRQATIRLAVSAHTRAGLLSANQGIGAVEVLPLCLEERPPAGEVDGEVLGRAGRDFLLIVGRMGASERYKGHEALFATLPRLLAERPTTRLVVAGDGDDRPRLEARAAALGLAPQVCFTGFVSEATLGELYRRAALFVMPSRGEGFGLVYLEAMRAGKPCVAARASAAAEIVADQETGLLVDPEDPADLTAALGRLLADPGLARAMGERGRRRGEQLFTPERFRRRLWPLLERLTGEPDVRHQRHP
jgi:phosphatidylinositol alpha-1,6-mannosyltransferase